MPSPKTEKKTPVQSKRKNAGGSAKKPGKAMPDPKKAAKLGGTRGSSRDKAFDEALARRHSGSGSYDNKVMKGELDELGGLYGHGVKKITKQQNKLDKTEMGLKKKAEAKKKAAAKKKAEAKKKAKK